MHYLIRLMQAALDYVIPYVQTRQQFSKPLSDFQLIQAKLADMYTKLNASRAFVYSVARNCDEAKKNKTDASSKVSHMT